MATRRRAKRKSLLGNLTDVERRLRYLEKRPAPSRLSKKVVGTDNIKPFAVSTDAIQPQAIVTEKIAALAVETEQIDNSAVTAPKIAENAVQQLQIAPNAVGTSEIANGAVVTDKLDGGAVTNAKLAPLAVAEGNMQQNSVSTDKIVDGDVTDIKIDTVSASKVTGQITNSQISSGIDGSKLVDGSVGDVKISGLSASKVSGVLATSNIPNLDTSKITTGTFVTDRIPNLDTGKITTGIFTTARIPNLSADKITSGTFTADRIPNLSAAKITSGTFALAQIPAVDSNRIQDGAVLSNKIPVASFVSRLVDTVRADEPISVFSSGAPSPVGGATQFRIRISVGTGANQVAAGNHTHAGGGATVPAHTHPATVSTGSIFVTSSGQQIGTTPLSVINHQHPYTRVIGVTVNQNTSSIRFKKDIENYDVDNVEKLLNLKLKKFKYRRELKNLHPNREWMYGYMAEDLIENGVEEVIGYDSEGLPESVNYGLLSVFVLELVKKQQNEIDSLKEEIQRLKEKI